MTDDVSTVRLRAKPLTALMAVTLMGACATSQETLNTTEDVTAYSTSALALEGSEISTLTDAAEIDTMQTARVVVFRDSPVSLAVSPKFRIDGREIGRCAFGRKTVTEVAPGYHELSSFSEMKNTRKFQIDAGETAYVRCTPVLGILVPNVRLDFVDAETGVTASSGMREVLVPLAAPIETVEN